MSEDYYKDRDFEQKILLKVCYTHKCFSFTTFESSNRLMYIGNLYALNLVFTLK